MKCGVCGSQFKCTRYCYDRNSPKRWPWGPNRLINDDNEDRVNQHLCTCSNCLIKECLKLYRGRITFGIYHILKRCFKFTRKVQKQMMILESL